MTSTNDTAARLPVIFISGYGRSGSTLLERILSQSKEVTAAGEICHIWGRGFVQNQRCGCEEFFGDCGFWSGVTQHIHDDAIDPELCHSIQNNEVRLPNLPRLLFPVLRSKKFQRSMDYYQKSLQSLYEGIVSQAQGRIVVDSSKDPLHGFVLASMPGIDVHVVHLVRDSRGVSYSWMRKRIRPEIEGDSAFMPTFSPTRSSLVWNLKNYLSGMLRTRANSYVRVRYEDLIDSPQETVDTIFRSSGLTIPEAGSGELTEGVAKLGVDHTCAGNPMRFKRGEIKLKLDLAWRKELPGGIRRYVTMLTYPWLRKYGYLE